MSNDTGGAFDYFFYNKNILITGVSGSLGSALSRELLKPEYGVKRLAGIARKWQPISELERELNDPRFRPMIGDIRDIERLRLAFREVDYVFHAAAIKDVILGTYNPGELVATNITGTENVLRAAIDCDVKRVLVVSSDKAADPMNAYGTSKRMAEDLTTVYNSYAADGRFACGRWGNVFASSGSVVPLFKKQRDAGVLTLASMDVTRFWIEMSAAVKFAMTCLVEMEGGEIFVPKLPASTIADLARAVAPDARYEITGLRPGDKMHEVMITGPESSRTDDLNWGYRIKPSVASWTTDAFAGGSPVAKDWVYSSASAPRLTVEQLRKML